MEACDGQDVSVEGEADSVIISILVRRGCGLMIMLAVVSTP